MTIRKIIDKGVLPISPIAPSPDHVSLVFAFDWGYLEQFKVTLASLAFSSNFIDSPIVIYTDDERVLVDNVVKLVSEKVVLLDGPKKQILYNLAKNHVKRPERENWNRGTFLKWMIFEEQPTTTALFLDVDMIFNGKFDANLIDLCDRSFNAAPQFRSFLYENNDKQMLSKKECYKNYIDIINSKYKNKMLENINSGVMFLKNDFLTDEFFNDITSFAVHQGKTVNEQAKFSAYFQQFPEKLRLLPCSFNFQESFLQRVSQDDGRELLKKIHVLHFAGSGKPWTKQPDCQKDSTRLTQGLWHWHRTLAQPLFSL